MKPRFLYAFSKMSNENHQVLGSESLCFDVGEENFLLDRSLEAFHNGSGRVLRLVRVDGESEGLMGGQRDQQVATGLSPTSSYRATLTRRSSWIKEEDNREENGSSFIDLGVFTPQLANPTKTRAKRPGTRRSKKNESSASRQTLRQQFNGQGTTRPSFLSKEPTKEGAGTSPAIKDTTAGSPCTPCAKDKVSNLRAQFEHMSS